MTLFGLNDNVVDIYLHIFPDLCMQTFLHTPLIRGTGISQAEWHGEIAISPVRGNKRRFYLICRVQRYLVETRVRIYKR